VVGTGRRETFMVAMLDKYVQFDLKDMLQIREGKRKQNLSLDSIQSVNPS
jgi:hypothetical protein